MSEKKEDAAAELLIKEVDDELRQENLHKLLHKHGRLLIGAAVALVIAVAAWQGWNAWQNKQRHDSAIRYTEAVNLADEGKLDEAATQLTALSTSGSAGYRLLADMKLAEIREQKGDRAGAASMYQAIASNSSVDAAYRDLALIKGAYLELDTADPAAIEKRIGPLAQESSPWRHSAREILALAALKKGDRARAVELFKKLADDVGAPQGLRARAQEMLAIADPKSNG